METPTRRALIPGSLVVALLMTACAGGGADTPQPMAESHSITENIADMDSNAQLAYLFAERAKNPDDAAVHFHLGNAFFAAEQPDSAIASYQRAATIDTSMSKAWVNMGLVYDATRRSEEASGAFKKAIRVNPNDVLAYCHLGQLEYTRKRVDEAMKLYKKALEIDPNSAQAHYNLGLAFADAKVFGEALVEWNRVVELDPGGDLGRTAAENVKLIRSYIETEP